MKSKALFLSLLLLAACGKEYNSVNERDLFGTWAHVKSVTAGNGEAVENLGETLVFSDDHVLRSYFSTTVFAYHWELEGRELSYGETLYTIKKLDSRHLTYTYDFNGDTFTDSWIKIEPLLPGTWTVSWTLGGVQYATFNADGTSTWAAADTGTTLGSFNWEVVVDLFTSRPAINYTGINVAKDIIMAAKDDELRVVDNNGTSGIYARGRLAVQ